MDSNSIEENVALYLEEQAIGYTDISIVEVGDPWVCFSCCGCYEGRDIEVVIDEEDLQKALDAGFSE